MNRLSVGNIYVASFAFAGNSSRGPYELVRVTDERGKDEITIFVNNDCIPSGIAKGDKFVLSKITEAAHYWRKGQVYNKETKQREEGWVEHFDLNADIKRVSSDLDGIEGGLPDDFEGVAPWDELSPDDQLPL